MRASILGIFIILAVSLPVGAMSTKDVQFVKVDPKVNVTTNVDPFTADAGFHQIKVIDKDDKVTLIPAFSIDPYDTHYPGVSFSSSDVLLLEDAPPNGPLGPMGKNKADHLHLLLSAYWTDSMTDNEAAGLQLAVWEIVAENELGIYDLSSGGYSATDPSVTVAQGQWYLDHFSDYDGPISPFAAICNYIDDLEESIDYVIRTPIFSAPAPAAIGLCGFGALLVNMVRRRRMG
jgi:hypothetical protein